MLASIRRFISRFRSPAPAAPAPAKKPKIHWAAILRELSSSDPPRVEYRLPTVLPGVRPSTLPAGNDLRLAMDGGYREEMAADSAATPAAWGFGFGGAGLVGPGLAFLGFPYLAELAQISEYRIPAESLSEEMTRRWLKVKNRGKRQLDDEISAITTRMDELNVRALFREAALKTEQFGRAHIYVSIKNQDGDLERQLPLTEIKKGSLLGFSCIEPYWLTPYSWNSTRPERSDFYKPQSWFVLGRKTHRTRLLTFIFREVPDLLKPAYDFAGISITQLMMPYINRWLRTAKSVNDLINIFSIVNLSTDLQSLLQDPTELLKRLQAFTQTRDNRGLMVTNKGTEELSTHDVSLGSLDKLQAQSQEHMATPARMPLIKFFGITPTGLNSSSDGEFQAWYDYVKGLLERGFSPHAQVVLQLVQMDLFGKVDPDITFEWEPLYEPTSKEKSEMATADAQRDGVYVDKGVVSPDEVRAKLQRDPDSGYDGLEGPAPEPPELPEAPDVETSDDED